MRRITYAVYVFAFLLISLLLIKKSYCAADNPALPVPLIFHEETLSSTIAGKLKDRLRSGSYDDVNNYFDQLIKNKPMTIDGTRLLEDIYTEMVRQDAKELWQSWTNSPNPSHAAFVIKGMWNIQQAWLTRGDGYSGTVSDKQWERMGLYLKQAQDDFEKAYAMEPADPNSAAMMIMICKFKSYPEGTMEDWFQIAVKADPVALRAYRNKLGYLSPWWHGSVEQMKKFAERCYSDPPKGSAVYSLLLNFYDQLAKYPHKRNSPNSKMYSLKNPDVKQKVENCLSRFEKEFPESRQAKLFRGRFARLSGQPYLALQIYNDILSDYPKHHDTLIAKGFFYSSQNNLAELLEPFKKAFEIEPDPRIAVNIAHAIRVTQQDTRTAIHYYDMAIKIAPLRYDLLRKRGDYYNSIGDRNSAMRDYSEALRINPADAQSYISRADLFTETKHYEKAKKDLIAAKAVNNKYKVTVEEKLEEIMKKEGNQEQEKLIASIGKPFQKTVIQKNPSPPKPDINLLLQHAENAYFLRKTEKANVLLYMVLEQDPENAKAFYLLGQITANLEVNHLNAIRFFNKAIQYNPKNMKYRLARGTSKYKAGHFRQAIEDFTMVLKEEPRNGKAYYYRGLSFDKIEVTENAIQDMQKAKLYGPEFASSAFQYLEEHAEKPKPLIEPAVEFQEQANDYMMMRRYDDAEKIFQKILRLNSKSDNAYLQLAQIALVRDRDHQKALSFYDKAIETNPLNKGAYNLRGTANSYLGRYKEAIKDYGSLLKLAPKDSNALSDRAMCYLKLNLYEEAYADFLKAKKYDPGRANYYDKYLSDISVKLNKPIDESLANASMLINRSDSYLREKEFQLAIDDLEKVLELEPDNHLANFKLGKIQAKIYKADSKALEYYSKAIELNPSRIDYLSTRGKLYYKQNNWQAAKEDFTKSLALEPQNAGYYYYRGQCYKQLGQEEAAIQDFMKTLELDQGWASAAKGELSE